MNKIIKYEGKLNILGDKLKELRTKNDLSLSQLSDKLQLLGIDIPKSSLHNLENGTRIIRDYELAGFSKIFNLSLDSLLKDFIKEL